MENVYQEEIASADKFRYQLLKKSEEETATPEELKQIDDLANDIRNRIKSWFDSLPFDFIMKQLSRLGEAPNLLYDDNGHWAVTSDGYQNVVFGEEPEDVETSFFIKAKQWKTTPKEALQYYINEED